MDIFKDSKNKDSICIMFRAIQDWRVGSKEWYSDRNVCVDTHPKHPILIEQLLDGKEIEEEIKLI